jgi:hypothetical protein
MALLWFATEQNSSFAGTLALGEVSQKLQALEIMIDKAMTGL